MPVLLVLYFAWSRIAVLVVTAVAAIAGLGIVDLIVVGIGPHTTFLSEVVPSLAQPRPRPWNQSLGGFFSLLFTQNDYTCYYVSNQALLSIAAGDALSQRGLLHSPLLVSLPFYGLAILWLAYVLIMIPNGVLIRASHAS